jgi:hypothetical protein
MKPGNTPSSMIPCHPGHHTLDSKLKTYLGLSDTVSSVIRHRADLKTLDSRLETQDS